MTRRLVAAALLAGTVGLIATPAAANHYETKVCIGGDDRENSGRMIGFCLQNPFESIG